MQNGPNAKKTQAKGRAKLIPIQGESTEKRQSKESVQKRA